MHAGSALSALPLARLRLVATRGCLQDLGGPQQLESGQPNVGDEEESKGRAALDRGRIRARLAAQRRYAVGPEVEGDVRPIDRAEAHEEQGEGRLEGEEQLRGAEALRELRGAERDGRDGGDAEEEDAVVVEERVAWAEVRCGCEAYSSPSRTRRRRRCAARGPKVGSALPNSASRKVVKWWPTKSSVRYSGITAVSAVLYTSYTAVADASTWNVSEPPYSRP